MIYANLHASFISDAVAAESLSFYDGADDDQLMAAAKLAESTANNHQGDAVDVQECPLTDDEIISATCQYLPYSNLIYYSLI